MTFWNGMSADDIAAFQSLVRITLGEFVVLEILGIVVLMLTLLKLKKEVRG